MINKHNHVLWATKI